MIGMGAIRVWGPTFVAVLIAVVGMGSLAGANMAINETAGQDEFANATTEIQNISTEVEQDIEANTTGIAGTITTHIMTPMVDVAIGATVASFKFGYHHPFLGKWLGRLAPLGMMATLGLYVYGLWKRMQRYQQ